ncbi:hypothetical protein Dimus_006396, partial [Dionaea muscipula]
MQGARAAGFRLSTRDFRAIAQGTEEEGVGCVFAKKKEQGGEKFGFVRYDCSVAAEVAIKRTNGVWMHDKELKVKMADYHTQQGASRATDSPGEVKGNVAASLGAVRAKFVRPVRNLVQHISNTSHVQSLRQRSPGLRMAWVPVRKGKHVSRVESYADAVRKGTRPQEDVPMVRVDTIGNGWLYRSVVASLADHRSTDYLLDSSVKPGVITPVDYVFQVYFVWPFIVVQLPSPLYQSWCVPLAVT